MIDYLKDNLWLAWMLVVVLALILEVSSGTFYLMCFAIGAACAMASSWLPVPFWAQVLAFIAGSAVSVFAVRPLVMRYLHGGGDSRPSNADALIGREGVVVEDIAERAMGYVKIDGDVWQARMSAYTGAAMRGDRVRVVSRDSIILRVERLPSSENSTS